MHVVILVVSAMVANRIAFVIDCQIEPLLRCFFRMKVDFGHFEAMANRVMRLKLSEELADEKVGQVERTYHTLSIDLWGKSLKAETLLEISNLLWPVWSHRVPHCREQARLSSNDSCWPLPQRRQSSWTLLAPMGVEIQGTRNNKC